MIAAVADTHTALWHFFDDARLSAAAGDPTTGIFSPYSRVRSFQTRLAWLKSLITLNPAGFLSA
jgi:hypothetical protein